MVFDTRRFPWAAVALAMLASTAATEPRAATGDAHRTDLEGLGQSAASSGSAPTTPSVPSAPVLPTSGVDPYLPAGPPYFSGIRRPESRQTRACSFRQPVCVHARRGLPSSVVLGTLTALERASTQLIDTLACPVRSSMAALEGPAFDPVPRAAGSSGSKARRC